MQLEFTTCNIIAILLSLVFLYFIKKSFDKLKKLSSTGIQAKAVIIKEYNNEGTDYIDYEFPDSNGNIHKGKQGFSFFKQKKLKAIKQQGYVDIVFNPSNPKDSSMQSCLKDNIFDHKVGFVVIAFFGTLAALCILGICFLKCRIGS